MLGLAIGTTIGAGVLVASALMFAAMRSRFSMPARQLFMVHIFASLIAAWVVVGAIRVYQPDEGMGLVFCSLLFFCATNGLFFIQRKQTSIVLDPAWPSMALPRLKAIKLPRFRGRKRPTYQFASGINVNEFLED